MMMSMFIIAIAGMMTMDMIRRMRRAMIMPHRPTRPIGPGFRCEGADSAGDPGTKAAQHSFQNVILADQQMVGMDLAGGMAVADMPGQAGQVAGDQQNLFLGRQNLDRAAVLELKTPVIIEVCHRWQVDHEAMALHRPQPLPPHQPGVIIHHHHVADLIRRLGQQAGHRGEIGAVIHAGILVNVEFTLAEQHGRRKRWRRTCSEPRQPMNWR